MTGQPSKPLAAFREKPVELLLLFPTDGVGRVAGAFGSGTGEWNETRLDRFWGTRDWRTLHARRERLEIASAEEARNEALRLYAGRVQELGYLRPLVRDVRMGGNAGRVIYSLVFATANTTGLKIMDQVFDKTGYWKNRDIARGIAPTGLHSGFVVDEGGGVYSFR